jgi:glycosyltransferase involved in cell wall biosynthesis
MEAFIKDVLPLLQTRLPEIKVYLVGSYLPERLKKLQSQHVCAVGWVDEVPPVFAPRRVFVSYLRYGAGMKGKLGQALSLGLPVVSTQIGAEGMELIDGETALIADTPEDFAEAVCRVYEDEALWQKLAQQGREAILARYGEAAVQARLQALLSPKDNARG